MNYKTQLKLAASGVVPFLAVYFGYKYTIFHGNLITVSNSDIVDTGHGAIVFNKVQGVKNQVYKEGWHLMVPWFERPVVYDLQSRPLTLKSVTGSKGKDIDLVLIP